jgi:hypothetical protein
MPAAEMIRPVVKRRSLKRASEFESLSVKIDQKPSIKMAPLGQTQTRESETIVTEKQLIKDQADKLAFADEKVKILIHRSSERFAPSCTDYIAVNGKGAEMLFKNGWVEIGYLPRGHSFYTKRKYVEQLAHAKIDRIETRVVERGADRDNYTDRVTSSVASFIVLEDANPLGAPWLESLVRNQA